MQDTSQDLKHMTLLTIFKQVLRGWHFLGFVVLGVFGGDFFFCFWVFFWGGQYLAIVVVFWWFLCFVGCWVCFFFFISATLFNHSEMP